MKYLKNNTDQVKKSFWAKIEATTPVKIGNGWSDYNFNGQIFRVTYPTFLTGKKINWICPADKY
jgi:adenine specific DNA methylase Mod